MRVQEQNEYQTQGMNGLGLMGGDHFIGGVGTLGTGFQFFFFKQ